MSLLFFLLALLLGSMPFAVWLTNLTGRDARAVGDGNPGATNALRAGGLWIGLIAYLLEFSKAAAPVGLAYQVYGIRGWAMAAIAFAPTLGHAFSPFLKFKGGKALATALGAWIGLTLWKVPLVALIGITVWYLLLKNSGWAVVLTLAGIAIYLLLVLPDPLFFQVLGLQTILLLWKHRNDLRNVHSSAK